MPPSKEKFLAVVPDPVKGLRGAANATVPPLATVMGELSVVFVQAPNVAPLEIVMPVTLGNTSVTAEIEPTAR